VLGYSALAIFFTTAGFLMAASPALPVLNGILRPPSDADTLALFQPGNDEEAQRVAQHIERHPLTAALRADPALAESRPHLKMPEALRRHNLTGGVLAGPRKIVVPPLAWSDAGGRRFVAILYLGADVCGHPGIVHGGLLATLLDEGFGRCCFAALPNRIGVTANLNINYRKPAPAGNYYVLRARTVKVEGRKAWVEGHIETLADPGQEPTIIAEGSALYVEPKQAAVILFSFIIS
jgi:adenylylsulfate kinase